MPNEVKRRIEAPALAAALERLVADHFQSRARLVRWQRRLSVYSSSYTIENLKLELEGGRQLDLVLKDLSSSSLLHTASKVRPQFLYNPTREIQTYRNILNVLQLGTPFCYGATVLPESDQYWLFLERVSGPLLWQRGRMESWELAARWLARLHHRFPGQISRDGETSPAYLARFDREFFNLWLLRAEAFLRGNSSPRDPSQWRRFGRLMECYESVVERLLSLPSTFIHGEFYPSNVILRRANGRNEVCPVDWELAAIGPSLIDLAALTSGEWPAEKRDRMIAAYRGALAEEGAQPSSMEDMIEAVMFCQLHLSVQLLGWASEWSPPKQHSQNWLRQALQLAEELGL